MILSPQDTTTLDGDPWICLWCTGGTEFSLERDILRAGFFPYVPRHTEAPRLQRGRRQSYTDIVRALYPSYAFVLGDSRAAARFVSCDFITTDRHVKRLPSLVTQSAIEKVRQAEQVANEARWQRWSPDVGAIIEAAWQAITGGLPKDETSGYMNLGDLQARMVG